MADEIYGTERNFKKSGSIPSCTSHECKKDSVADGWKVPTYTSDVLGADSVYRLNQRQSIPACHSAGCKTASATSGFDVPAMSPEIYGNNGEYTYGTNDHLH